jgi:hypothetical protein
LSTQRRELMISDLPSVVSQLRPPMNIFLFDRKGHTSGV